MMVIKKDIKLLNDIRHYGDLLQRIDENEGMTNTSYQMWTFENMKHIIKLVNGELEWIITID